MIGITLVVAGDSFFLTLFIVIVFHQVFEGLALGSRIAALGTKSSEAQVIQRLGHGHGHDHHVAAVPLTPAENKGQVEPTTPPTYSSSVEEDIKPPQFSLAKKCILASAFAFITPLGMAIGIGAIQQFNGNDPSTVLAIAILNSISCGILLWVGIVEMWAEDWMYSTSELMNTGPILTGVSMFALMAGMALMGFLGKWA